MVAMKHDDVWSGSSRKIGFAQGAQRLLFVAVDDATAGRARVIDAQLVDRSGKDVRFSGVAGGSVVSLTAPGGALLVGVLGEHELTGSVVFPDGNAQTFAVELARI